MREEIHPVLIEGRVRQGPYASDYGQEGMFVVPCYAVRPASTLVLMCGTGMGWEHVSVSVQSKRGKRPRLPIWKEMAYVKDLFWKKDEVVMQLHPAEKDYVDNWEVLHLWRPVGGGIPVPPPTLVGVPGVTFAA